ncbi:hypothetical protein SUGI_0223610 [Cryptomeria japonica]|uniref:putative inactive G-type lectin S-receptor-like serine/threonine-protein kinase SRK n=1 Tax=Cryptomeria japonica TaxID=3369 RepID=UPI002408CCF7|nr:putative inactive G-type lectin S-receptor-like serine/threonine-protein kinase SRK [Cryptomeria japonica]GLJ13987.1 hypothetical protein SUGI_0223610 [Cryptomeria japonica]
MGREKNALTAYMLVALLMVFLNGVEGGDTLRLGDSISGTGDQTLLSKNGKFELGFFSPDENNTNWYIGIWYTNMADRAIVWVANRETPVSEESGVLNVSRDGYLALFDAQGALVWSPNVSKKASRAVILDSGNFLVLGGENHSEIIWQSFDHPGDSWLPGMKLRRGQKLVPWKNSFDPACQKIRATLEQFRAVLGEPIFRC